MAGRPSVFRQAETGGTPSVFRRDPDEFPPDMLFDDAPGLIDDMPGNFDTPGTSS